MSARKKPSHPGRHNPQGNGGGEGNYIFLKTSPHSPPPTPSDMHFAVKI
jgi:hypothetical protein